ncbi:ATP-grasp domain-containing protein [Anatilimnocola sp. NA78]|uniref:ATP-grasp domain-containing protein n=1 Tax=Anatilimnocola sp. NA78 TaxID=3415683 RepID=UPI003CE5A4CF
MARTVFIYEFLTAAGCWSLGDAAPGGSLLAEGRAMRDALARDFAAMQDVDRLLLMHDERLPAPSLPKQQLQRVQSAADEQRLFQQLAAEATATVIIAPEFSQLLLQRVRWAEQVGATLLSPGSQLVELASDKQRTADLLLNRGVRTPRGISVSSDSATIDARLFPAVVKPNDGCGSQGVRQIESATELATVDWSQSPSWRLEPFVPGIAVSAAIVGGPKGVVCLPPCEQRLSTEGHFVYQGGRCPLPPNLAERATSLALAAARSLPKMCGWIGIDMVLGSAQNGASDFVIEINPRLTTSYIGLRCVCRQNLAELMWRVGQGAAVEVLSPTRGVEFQADGTVREIPFVSSP